eukprot:m.963448 g.963448  ORF g.963448 m.963448 type:complete len:636 (-) comp23895_c0_seq12:323-2230(-)
MFYGLVHRINTTVFGNFLPRKAGSVLIYHKAAFYLLALCVAVHAVGHIAIVATRHAPAVLDALPPPTQEYYFNVRDGSVGVWLLAWTTGVTMVILMAVLLLSSVCCRVFHTRFRLVHRSAAGVFLACFALHGWGRILAFPVAFASAFVIVLVCAAYEFWWVQRHRIHFEGSHKINATVTRCSVIEDAKHLADDDIDRVLPAGGAPAKLQREDVFVFRFRADKINKHNSTDVRPCFRPGEYCLMRAPALSNRWHPFTIVCLRDDTEYELHVKVKPRTTSWTRGFTILWDQHVLYKAMMDKRSRFRAASAHELSTRAPPPQNADTTSPQTEAVEGVVVMTDGPEHSAGPQYDREPRMSMTIELIGGFASSFADPHLMLAKYVVFIGFSVGATPAVAHIMRMDRAHRNTVWLFLRTSIPRDSPETKQIAYLHHVQALCQRRQRELGRHVASPSVGNLLRVSTLSREEFWEQNNPPTPLSPPDDTTSETPATAPTETPDGAIREDGTPDVPPPTAQQPSISQFLQQLVSQHDSDDVSPVAAVVEPAHATGGAAVDGDDVLPTPLLERREPSARNELHTPRSTPNAAPHAEKARAAQRDGGGTVVVHVGYCGPGGGLRSLLRVVHGGGLRQRVKVFAEVF